MAKNGEVKPLSLNNKYEITNSPTKNPRRELFKINVVREKRSKNKSVKKMGNIGNGVWLMEN